MSGNISNGIFGGFARAVAMSRAPFMALGGTGVVWGAFATMVPALKAQTGATDAQFGLALLGSATGGMIAMYLAPYLLALFKHRTLPILAVFAAMMLQIPLLVSAPWHLFPMMVAIGLAVASFDIGANLRISQLEAQSGLHLMNINHANFSLFLGIAAILTGLMRGVGWGIPQVFPLIGVILLGFAWLCREEKEPAEVESEEDSAAPARLPWAAILPVAVMLFVSFMGENAIESWSALFLERELGGAPGQGGFGPAMLGFIMFIFRLMGQVTTQRFGEARVVLFSGVMGVIGALTLSQSMTQAVALLGIALTAIGMAVIVPTATSLLGKHVHKRHRSFAVSRAWMIGFAGFFVGPSVIGLISESYGLRIAFLFVAAMVALIIPAVWRLERAGPAPKT
ncbi:MFS transporter [Celeribacter neptunius]|uniref:Fucose permease n=1 Tax=Celeribacter neptunius TaxID=588602 RepID=A0A1I3VI23_9RHOB|nr:MFS transporter [Celeribacter neptunius]SFJ95018.1 Fucose permease [Celeribacter neptunius]